MKILLLGKNGQVGWELQRALAPLCSLLSLDRQGQEGFCGDLQNLDGLGQTIRRFRPDIIVNAAAHTAVDKAESEPDLAYLLNADAPRVLAQEAASLDALLVHYSTDYVFDGSGNVPWAEDNKTEPLSVYGKSKLAGEQAILETGCRHLIFRSSWVYAARGGNFAKTMLRLAQERDRLSVINDQFGAPTSAELIADITAHAIRQTQLSKTNLSGIYHLAANGITNWNEYARLVVGFAHRKGVVLRAMADHIDPIPTSAFLTPAKRPHNSRLNTQKLQQTFGLTMPYWKEGVERMLSEVLG